MAMKIITRLLKRNPSNLLPYVRKILVQLLTQLEYSSDPSKKVDSGNLLSCLLSGSGVLLKSYTESILKTLLPRLKEEHLLTRLSCLRALGELSKVDGQLVSPYIKDFFPLLIGFLQNQGITTKERLITYSTLGTLASGTSHVVSPFFENPNLLQIILNDLKTSKSVSLRKEIIRGFGLLGAIDPYKQKQVKTDNLENYSKISDLNISSDVYYTSVAIIALTKMLRNTSLSRYAKQVVSTILFIVNRLQPKEFARVLPLIVPPLTNAVDASEPGLRALLFQKLKELVTYSGENIAIYCPQILEKVKAYWKTDLFTTCVSVVEELVIVLGGEFKVYVPDFIPLILEIINGESENTEKVLRIFNLLELMSSCLDGLIFFIFFIFFLTNYFFFFFFNLFIFFLKFTL